MYSAFNAVFSRFGSASPIQQVPSISFRYAVWLYHKITAPSRCIINIAIRVIMITQTFHQFLTPNIKPLAAGVGSYPVSQVYSLRQPAS